MELVHEVYRVTRTFPAEERFGLVSQLRRAAVSVPSNIAEGYGRNSANEFHQFVGHARGSLAELETQVEIAGDLHFLAPDAAKELLEKISRIGRMLTGLREWSARRGA